MGTSCQKMGMTGGLLAPRGKITNNKFNGDGRPFSAFSCVVFELKVNGGGVELCLKLKLRLVLVRAMC